MAAARQYLVGTQKQSRAGRSVGRRAFMALIGSSAVNWPLRSRAQPHAAPPKRVGVLSLSACQDPPASIISRRLAELGWIEGRTFTVECVSTVGRFEQFRALARDLVSRGPDVLVATPFAFIKAFKQETATIPIIMIATPDPVRLGLVTNLARPEGNVTGVAWFGFDILTKRLEILKEILPGLSRLAIITSAYGDSQTIQIIEENVATAARALGFAWQHFRPAVTRDYDAIFARIAAEHFDAVYIQADPLSNQPQNRARIIQLALHHRMPAMQENPQWARSGLLVSYGQDYQRDIVRASEYIDKILHGATATELPIEQTTEVKLVINLKTASALGLAVPPALITRADELVE